MVPSWLLGAPQVYNCTLPKDDVMSLFVCTVCAVENVGVTISVSLVGLEQPSLFAWYNILVSFKVCNSSRLLYGSLFGIYLGSEPGWNLGDFLFSYPGSNVGIHRIYYIPHGSKVRYTDFLINPLWVMLAVPPTVSGTEFVPPPSGSLTTLPWSHGCKALWREAKRNRKQELLIGMVSDWLFEGLTGLGSYGLFNGLFIKWTPPWIIFLPRLDIDIWQSGTLQKGSEIWAAHLQFLFSQY